MSTIKGLVETETLVYPEIPFIKDLEVFLHIELSI